MQEIIALEQQGFVKKAGQGVRDASTKIEASAVTPLAVARKGCAGDLRLLLIETHDLHLGCAEKEFKIGVTLGTETGLNHDREFHERGGRE